MSNEPDFERSMFSHARDARSPEVLLRTRDEALADLAEQRTARQADRREVAARKSFSTLRIATGIDLFLVTLLAWHIGAHPSPVMAWFFVGLAYLFSAAAIRVKTGTAPVVWSRTMAAALQHEDYERALDDISSTGLQFAGRAAGALLLAVIAAFIGWGGGIGGGIGIYLGVLPFLLFVGPTKLHVARKFLKSYRALDRSVERVGP